PHSLSGQPRAPDQSRDFRLVTDKRETGHARLGTQLASCGGGPRELEDPAAWVRRAGCRRPDARAFNFVPRRPSGQAGPGDDDRARTRRLRIACGMGRRGRRATQGRLPVGDADARPDFCGGRRGGRALDAGFDPWNKILVGHSYGGFVITNAASGPSDVSGLVYAAAYAPESGETITSMSVGYAAGAFLQHLLLAPAGFPFFIV